MKTVALMFGMLTLIACTQRSSPVVIATPKQKPYGDVMYRAALLRDARLAVDNGCLLVFPASGSSSYLAVFPYGYSAKASSNGYTILDASGKEWGRTNVSLDVGGGEGTAIDARLCAEARSILVR